MEAPFYENNNYYSPGDRPPPPTYAQVVGAAPQHVPLPSPPVVQPNFTFVDFTPDGQTSKYPDLLEKANFWLSQNRDYRLQSCETVTVPVKNGVVCIGNSVNHIPSHNGRDYASILRCWLVKSDGSETDPQVIRTLARVPDKKKSMVTVSMGNYFHAHAQILPMGSVFTPMSDCLQKINEDLQENPLQGKILRVETVRMKVTDRMSHVVNLNPNTLFWTDGDQQTMYTKYIRVFYIEGPPAHEQIGWHDVVPTYELNRANRKRPKFEPFSNVMFKAWQWANMQTTQRITNIQTIEMPLEVDGTLLNRASSQPILDTNDGEEHSGYMYNPLYTGALVKYLRLYHVTSASNEVTTPCSLTPRLFLPYKMTARVYETPLDNIQRLGIWLTFNSTMENNIICAETVTIGVRDAYSSVVDPEQSSYTDLRQRAHDVVSGIRLYMNGVCNEPPVAFLGIPYQPVQTNQSSCCTIL